MNILWFVNIPFPEVRKQIGLPAVGGNGFWMIELLESLKGKANVNISIAWSGRSCKKSISFTVDNITYYCVPETRWEDLGLAKRNLLRHWSRIVQEVQPDLIEFHGTEKYHGLLADMVQVPTLVSIQGILKECFKCCFGPLSILKRIRYRKLLRLCFSYRIKSLSEKRIFKINGHFVGRTDWDRKMLDLLNPEASYYQCPEIVRVLFRQMTWSIKNIQDPPLLVSTASGKPLKGCDVLIKAASELKQKGVQYRLVLIGNFPEDGYGSYLRKLAQKLCVDTLISFAGYAEPEKMLRIYSKATAFIISSYIENSPNSLAEAMVFGMPCIASRTGGIPSMIKDGTTGLLFKNRDHVELADHIHSVILNPKLAAELGANARRRAMKEHDPIFIADKMHSIYTRIVEQA